MIKNMEESIDEGEKSQFEEVKVEDFMIQKQVNEKFKHEESFEI